MEIKTSLPNSRIKELADRFKGDMSYSQHYAYLLDWYMNDRNSWKPNGRQPEVKVRSKHRGNIFTRLVDGRMLNSFR